MNIIQGIPSQIEKDCFVSLDTEWFGLNPKQLHRPTSGKFGCLTICPNDEDVYFIDNPELIKPALDNLKDCVWATQNGKFDIVQLRRHVDIRPRKKWWDTLYIEKIMYGGYYDTFGLEDLARRHLNIELDKSAQKSFEKATEWNEELIRYACMDALITRQVAIEQRKQIDKKSFNIWTEIDRPFTWAVMDFRGFPINPDKIKELADRNTKRAEEIGATLPFNYKSPKQILDWARNRKIKISATDEEELTEYSIKHPDNEESKIFSAVLEARKLAKMSSTYGMNLIEDYMEYDEDGYPVIYPNINPNQAETGRTSSSDPNIQNQPNTPEFRACYEAAPGHKLIIADYSGQEPRITAYVTQDKKLIQIFKENKDVYSEMFFEIFGKRIDKKCPERKKMKAVFLGMTYGLTEYGFSKKYDVMVEEAKELLRKSMATFPDVLRWQDKQYKQKKFVETVNGRRVWINPYSYQANNNKLNAPIQGTAADMMKKAIATMYETWCFDIPFCVVAPVHDEVVLHAPEKLAEEIKTFTKDTLERVAEEMCPGIPFIADACIANNWSEKS